MRKHYMMSMAVAAMAWVLGCTLAVQAVDRPKTAAGAPADGGKYVLVNAYSPTGYMDRTSWDGALYFNGTSINEANVFTAQKNENDTWSFYYVTGTGDEEVRMYLAMPTGSGNLNAKSEELAEWTLEAGTIDGYYGLRAGAGNSDASQGLLLHLNAGGQYFVISEAINGGDWYPDYAGGAVVEEDEDEDNVYVKGGVAYKLDENGRCILADHTSENWQFIQVEDVPAYMACYQAYAAVANLEKAVADNEEYAEGFQASLDAALAIYNSSEFNWEEDPATLTAMYNAKMTLFNKIEEAKAIEDEDGLLASAITSAEAAFKGNTSAETLDAATKALEDAIAAFHLGNGDITGFGQNMSFEDLSAQNGNQTSGVAAPPAGWNVFINGKQVTTADEVRAAGVTAWHGVNNDCDGEPKDGNYGFGIWNGGVPQYEISQTIEGLENGTYVITAGLMVGANGNGSRRTTQRVFGNLNATYFASEGEYVEDLLDPKEVKDYAGLIEETTDRTLQPVTVRAYVYDGKLTFGVRTDGNIQAAGRESSNGAGGDGWFKTDNFRIMKEGYIGEDAANVANYYIGVFEQFNNLPMEASLEALVEDVLDNYESVSADTPADEINQIIVTLLNNLDAVQASVAAYDKLWNAIDQAYAHVDEYSYLDISAYEEAIEEANSAYEDGTVDEAGVEELIAKLDEAYETLKTNAITVGEYANIIKNPSFEDLSAQNNTPSGGTVNPPAGWKLKLNGVLCETAADYSAAGAQMGWCAINNGDNISSEDENGVTWTTQYTDGTHLWGIWAGNVPEVELYQEFSGLPAGTYTLSCDAVVQYNWGGHCITTQRIFANSFIQMFGAEETYEARLNDTPDMKAAREDDEANPDADLKHLTFAGHLNESAGGVTDCPRPMSVTCGVGEDGVLILGFRTNNVDPFSGEAHPYDSAGWFKLDNFQLLYESDELPTGVECIKSAGNGTTITSRQYFSLDGAEVAQPQQGINIVKNTMSDGSVRVVKMFKK